MLIGVNKMKNGLCKNGAEILCDGLRQQGVRVVFGIAGLQNIPLLEALRTANIRVITATHEQGAALMAAGYNRATGKTGVFFTIPGPGLTSACTGIAEAYLDSCAVVAVVCGVRTDIPQKFQLHQIDQPGLLQPITKAMYRVRTAGEMAALLEEAFCSAASGEPGPVALEAPANVFREPRQAGPVERLNRAAPLPPGDPDAALPKIIARLRQARRVGLLAGLGAADAAAGVRQLAERLAAPVATTLSGRGCLPEDHPLSLGFAWREGGLPGLKRILDRCDLILAIGVKFSETGSNAYQLPIYLPLIHVDASEKVLGANYPVDLKLVMDSAEFLERLLAQAEQLPPRQDAEMLEMIRQEREKCLDPQKEADETRFQSGGRSYSPQEFFQALRNALPADAIIVTDTGYHQVLTNQNVEVRLPRTLINPTDFQSMGYAIPAALGAAVGQPGRKVIAVLGDGGFLMSAFELLTAAREKIDLGVIVFNNHGFGWIKRTQLNTYGAACGVALAPLNFRALCESFHIRYQAPEDELKTTLLGLTQGRGPALLEVWAQHPEPGPIRRMQLRWKQDLKGMARRFSR